MNEPERQSKPEPEAQSRWWHTIKAVAWAMLGVRKGTEYERDFARLTPLHVVLVGLVAIFALVIGLIVLVNWVTR